jgi:hypothetical protein
MSFQEGQLRHRRLRQVKPQLEQLCASPKSHPLRFQSRINGLKNSETTASACPRTRAPRIVARCSSPLKVIL